MPKYQLILESDIIYTDQEAQKYWQTCVRLNTCFKQFKFITAQNLEGIRKELWEQKTELKDTLMDVISYKETEQVVDNTFSALSNLFKLD